MQLLCPLSTPPSGCNYIALPQIACLEGTSSHLPLGEGGGVQGLLVYWNNSNQIIYLTASVSDSEKGSNTSLFSAKLDGDSLVDLKQLYKASPDSEEQRHFG